MSAPRSRSRPEKVGTIYSCDGKFQFVEYEEEYDEDEDEDEEWGEE